MAEIMLHMDIRQHFNQIARDYDSKRKIFVPCFDDFYGTAIDLIPFKSADNFNVIDLGAGTGLFSALIRAAFPNAAITLVDVAEEMLAVAEKRFAGDPGITLLAADYLNIKLPPATDTVVSALSIHHLENDEKRALFRNIFDGLKPGGRFINVDLVLGETPESERQNLDAWLDKIKKAGATDDDMDLWHERSKLDRFTSLSSQLQWLTDSGFSCVDCFYKYYNFAVFSGIK